MLKKHEEASQTNEALKNKKRNRRTVTVNLKLPRVTTRISTQATSRKHQSPKELMIDEAEIKNRGNTKIIQKRSLVYRLLA